MMTKYSVSGNLCNWLAIQLKVIIMDALILGVQLLNEWKSENWVGSLPWTWSNDYIAYLKQCGISREREKRMNSSLVSRVDYNLYLWCFISWKWSEANMAEFYSMSTSDTGYNIITHYWLYYFLIFSLLTIS